MSLNAAAAIIHVHSVSRPLLTHDIAKMAGHSIASCPDYVNALLHGISANNLNKVQIAQTRWQKGLSYPTFHQRYHALVVATRAITYHYLQDMIH